MKKWIRMFPGAWSGLLAVTLVLALGAGTASAQKRVYVADGFTSVVHVIDAATNTVMGSIPMPAGAATDGLAATPNGAFVYVANPGADEVAIINTAANAVSATVKVGAGPRDVAVTPNGAFAYVANQSSNDVSVIATATRKVVATVPVGSQPLGVAVTPDGAYAWVTNFGSQDISVLETANHTVVATIPLGATPLRLAFTPDGAYAYVQGVFTGPVYVVSTVSHTVVATVPAGGGREIAIRPDGGVAFAPAVMGRVDVIDVATNSVAATVPIGTDGRGIDADGVSAYVASNAGLSVIDAATFTVTTIPVGDTLNGVAIATPGPTPLDKAQCKDGGWQFFTAPSFKNQGDCVSFIQP